MEILQGSDDITLRLEHYPSLFIKLPIISVAIIGKNRAKISRHNPKSMVFS